MGKLSMSPARLSTISRQVGFGTSQAKGPLAVQANAPWRAWYKTKAWRELKRQIHVRDSYTCQRTGVICSGKHPHPDSPVANHKRPHRGDEALFWDPDNIETVTKAIHDGLIQAEEQASRHTIGVWD